MSTRARRASAAVSLPAAQPPAQSGAQPGAATPADPGLEDGAESVPLPAPEGWGDELDPRAGDEPNLAAGAQHDLEADVSDARSSASSPAGDADPLAGPLTETVADPLTDLCRRHEALLGEYEALPGEDQIARAAMAAVAADRARASALAAEARALRDDADDRARRVQSAHHAAATRRHEIARRLAELDAAIRALTPPAPPAQT